MKTLCCSLLLAVCAAAQTGKALFHRVDDQVYRGKQPQKEDVARLAQMGVKTVLDLRGGLVHKRWEREAVEAAGMRSAQAMDEARAAGFSSLEVFMRKYVEHFNPPPAMATR